MGALADRLHVELLAYYDEVRILEGLIADMQHALNSTLLPYDASFYQDSITDLTQQRDGILQYIIEIKEVLHRVETQK
jgi:hypothetical protein